MEDLALPRATVQYDPHWLATGEADELLDVFRQELRWEQSTIQVYGRQTTIPRLNAWYGDDGCHYGYSGYQLPLHPWHDQLHALRLRLQEALGVSFNSVLANLYRNGDDSVGWHADDEPELGDAPVIASISLGAERSFRFKPKQKGLFSPVTMELQHGSLLMMSGETQSHWLHEVPKRRNVTGDRINLTFRRVFGAAYRV